MPTASKKNKTPRKPKRTTAGRAKAKTATARTRVVRRGSSRKPTSDASTILHRRYFEGKADRLQELEEARAEALVARKVFNARTEAGLSQRALAKLVGTTASVISRLEDADYEGHSLAMLRRVAAALNKRLEVRFVSAGK